MDPGAGMGVEIPPGRVEGFLGSCAPAPRFEVITADGKVLAAGRDLGWDPNFTGDRRHRGAPGIPGGNAWRNNGSAPADHLEFRDRPGVCWAGPEEQASKGGLDCTSRTGTSASGCTGWRARRAGTASAGFPGSWNWRSRRISPGWRRTFARLRNCNLQHGSPAGIGGASRNSFGSSPEAILPGRRGVTDPGSI